MKNQETSLANEDL